MTWVTRASDDFNRAGPGLGANWTLMTADPGIFIINGNVLEGTTSNPSGATRTGETYAGNHSSSIEKTADAIPGTGWIGTAVRVRNGGADSYLGIYYNTSPNYVMQLYKRVAGGAGGGYTQLTNTIGGDTITIGAAEDPAGTVYKVTAVDSRIAFERNGVERIVSVDTTHATGGAPGVADWIGASKIDNWIGQDWVTAAGTSTTLIGGVGF